MNLLATALANDQGGSTNWQFWVMFALTAAIAIAIPVLSALIKNFFSSTKAELMTELDSVKKGIGHVETQVDSMRNQIDTKVSELHGRINTLNERHSNLEGFVQAIAKFQQR